MNIDTSPCVCESVRLRNIRVVLAGAHGLLTIVLLAAFALTGACTSVVWLLPLASLIACAGARLLGRGRSAWLVPLVIHGVFAVASASAVVALLHFFPCSPGTYGSWLASMAIGLGLLAMVAPVALMVKTMTVLLPAKTRDVIEREALVSDHLARALWIAALVVPVVPSLFLLRLS